MSGQHSHGKKKGGNKNATHASHDETPLSKFPKSAQAPASSGAAATGRPDPNTILKPSQVSPVATTPQPPRANGSSSSSSTPAASPSLAANDKGITKPPTPRGSPSGSGAGAAPSSTARPRHASPLKTSPGKPSPTKTAEKPAASKQATTAHALSPAPPPPPPAEAVGVVTGKKGKSPAKQAVTAAAAAVVAAEAASATETAVKATPAEATPTRRSSVEVCTTPDTGLASPPTRPDPVQDPPASSPVAPAQAPPQSAVVEPVPTLTTEAAAPVDSQASDPATPATITTTSQPLLASAAPFLSAILLPETELQADMQASPSNKHASPTSMLATTPERKPQGEAWENDYQNASFETFSISEAGIGGTSSSNAFDEADEIMASILGGKLSPRSSEAGMSSSAVAAQVQLEQLLASPDLAVSVTATDAAPTLEQQQLFLSPDLLDNVLGDRAGGSGSENFPIPAFVMETGALPVLLAAVSDAAAVAAADVTAVGGAAPPGAAQEGAVAGIEVAGVEVEDGWLRSASGALAPRHLALFSVLRALVRARTMGQHKEALSHFSRTVMWDVPPILMRDREQMRVAVYLAKFAAHMDFRAVIVGVNTATEGWEIVEALLSFQLCPIMPWWMTPVRLIVPKRIDIQATVRIGTRPSLSRSPDRVTWLWGRIHNFPAFPDLARVFNAFMMGRLAVWTEPLWCRVLWMVGDSSYGRNAHGKLGVMGAGKGQGHVSSNY